MSVLASSPAFSVSSVFLQTLDGNFNLTGGGSARGNDITRAELVVPLDAEIPLPAALPLLLAGLGGLAVVARRRDRA
ncbi:MAG: VPLPA-CTERM sorting domain-containing protein [Paracoccaceae bacterium]